MKKWNKGFLILLCLCMILGTTACGSRDNTSNEGTTDQTAPEQNNMGTDTTDNNVVDDMGNAVGDGMDNVGNAIDDGMNAIGDGVDNMTDDLTEDSTTDSNVNDATENTRTRTTN